MSWFLSLPYLLRIFISLVIAFIMLFIVVSLSSSRQKNEMVWATGEKEIKHSFADLPLTVYADSSFGDAHMESILMAINDMNAAGCTLVVIVDEPKEAYIHIRHEPCDRVSRHPGCTWKKKTSNKIVIQVGEPGTVTMSYLLFFHELTHAFGLAHDGVYPVPDSSSDALIFVPITANNAFEHSGRLGQGKLLPGLTGKDSAALKKRYCPSL